MWNEPSATELDKLPRPYATEHVPLEEKVVHMHFFLGESDWYVVEYSPTGRMFFGYAILNDDHDNAEWGYIALDELRGVNVHGVQVDRDLHWTPRKVREIERIRR